MTNEEAKLFAAKNGHKVIGKALPETTNLIISEVRVDGDDNAGHEAFAIAIDKKDFTHYKAYLINVLKHYNIDKD